jgi:hypothetical protein
LGFSASVATVLGSFRRALVKQLSTKRLHGCKPQANAILLTNVNKDWTEIFGNRRERMELLVEKNLIEGFGKK